MSQPLSAAAKRLLGVSRPAPRFRDGGLVRGPGSPTSDSVDAKLSRDEFVLPADTVRAVGLKSLRDLVAATHEPTGQGRRGRRFADGGMVDDELKKPNSFGDAAAATSAPGTSIVQAPSAPPPAPMPSPSSPSNTFPGNRMQGDSGISGAPTSASTPASAVAASNAPAKDFTREDLIAQIPKDEGPSISTGRQVGDSWKDTDIGRNVYNSAMALPGVAGALPAVAKTGGLITKGIDAASRLMEAGAMEGARAAAFPTAAAASSLENQNPLSAGAGRGRINPEFADPSKPPPTSTVPAPAPAPAQPSWDRSGMTNAEVGAANPQGRVTAQRQANGTMSFSGDNVSGPVSYTNAKGDALPGGGINGRGFGSVTAAPAGSRMAMDDNGNYAFATSGSGTSGGGGAASRLLNAGAQSPVGMTPEQAFQAGLITSPTPTGYNPAYDQRLNQGSVGLTPNASQDNGGDAQARLMAAGSGGFTGVVGQQSGNGNMWSRTPEQQRRDAEVQASSIHKRTAATGANALRAMDGQDLENVRGANALQREGMQQSGSMARERLQQTGATERANIGARHYEDSNAIARGDLAIRQNAAAFQNRAAQRQEQAQQDLENAKSQEEQRNARQRLLALMGKTDDDHWQGVALQGGMDAQGNKTDSVLAAVNRRTGEMKRLQTQSSQQAAPAEGAKVRGKDGRVYVVKNGKPVPVGG